MPAARGQHPVKPEGDQVLQPGPAIRQAIERTVEHGLTALRVCQFHQDSTALSIDTDFTSTGVQEAKGNSVSTCL
jgi:hypothetical protein